MRQPSPGPFAYKAANAPLYFTEPFCDERTDWARSMKKLAREFSKVASETKDHTTVLSNGVTAGEYALWYLNSCHDRRMGGAKK